jgi:hypothetical protein
LVFHAFVVGANQVAIRSAETLVETHAKYRFETNLSISKVSPPSVSTLKPLLVELNPKAAFAPWLRARRAAKLRPVCMMRSQQLPSGDVHMGDSKSKYSGNC